MSVETKEEMARPASETRRFFAELHQLGETIPCKLCFAVLLLAWLALFHFLGNATFGYVNTPSLFGWLRYVYYSSPDDESLVILIPPIILALLWWKRNELAALPKRIWWPAFIVFGFAVLVHIFGYI